jgi:hypothetical protein
MHGSSSHGHRSDPRHDFYKADPDYGIGVATRLGLSAADLPSASAAAAE